MISFFALGETFESATCREVHEEVSTYYCTIQLSLFVFGMAQLLLKKRRLECTLIEILSTT